MNPEREDLLQAFDELREAPNREEAARLKASYELLLDNVVEKHPHLKKLTLHMGLMKRYPLWLRAKNKTSALPPKA